MTTKDKLHKIMQGLRLGCVALVLGIMIYGITHYLHAPIRQRDGGYFDKAGQAFTEAQFRAFQTWEYCLFGSFGLAVIVSIPLAVSKRSRRERG